jgi:hypothetical protein
VRLLGRNSALNSSLGKLVRSDVLEVDRTPGYLGDDLDLLARGQRLRTGEEVPLSHVTFFGEGGHGDACDIFRVDHTIPTFTGCGDDLAPSDGVEPPEGVGREGVGPQIGHTKTGLPQDLLASRESGLDGAQRQHARADGGQQDDLRRSRVPGGVDHRLGLLGPASDLHQKDAVDALNRFRHAVGVVEIADGELDPGRETGRSSGVAHQCPDAVTLFV